MAGRKTFTAGEVLQAADVNDYLMDQSVMVFAGTAARGSAIPSPTEGMVTYRSDDDALEVYTTDWTAIGGAGVLQVVHTSSTAITTGNAAIPHDNTIPQQTEGTEFLTVSITPQDASSLLLVEGVITWAEQTNVQGKATTALFRDSGNDAISTQFSGNGDQAIPVVIRTIVSAGSTASTTFKIRCGMEATQNIQLNRNVAAGGLAPAYGSTQESTLTVMEIAQ